MDWIISLAAVLVSMLTIVISYLTNRENLRHARQNALDEHRMSFNETIWKEIIDLADALAELVNHDAYERLANSVILAKSNEEGKDEVLNAVSEVCSRVNSKAFNLCTRIKALDRENTALIDRILRYAEDVVRIVKTLEEYFLGRGATYHQISENAATLREKEAAFRSFMLNYAAELQDGLFDMRKTNKEKQTEEK